MKTTLNSTESQNKSPIDPSDHQGGGLSPSSIMSSAATSLPPATAMIEALTVRNARRAVSILKADLTTSRAHEVDARGRELTLGRLLRPDADRGGRTLPQVFKELKSCEHESRHWLGNIRMQQQALTAAEAALRREVEAYGHFGDSK